MSRAPLLQALEREARAGDLAVLVTAHDTKAARDAMPSGPGASG